MKASVCIITYNHANFIAQAIEGALMQQTDFPYEILIGEDESTDGTRAICQAYADRYPDKISLFLRSRADVIHVDGRPTGRYNLTQTLKAATGHYIALCEGDDYWTDPHKLQKQVDFLEAHPEYVVAYHDKSIIDQHNNLLVPRYFARRIPPDYTGPQLTEGVVLHTPTVCFRNLLSDYPPEYMHAPHGDIFIFGLLGAHGGAKYMGDTVGPSVYRIHGGGVWSKLNEIQRKQATLNTRYWMGRYFARIGRPRPVRILFTRYHSEFYQLLVLLPLTRDLSTFRQIIAQFRANRSWRYAPGSLVLGLGAAATALAKSLARQVMGRARP